LETSRRILIALSVVLVVSRAIAADAPCDDPCGKPTSWFDFNVFTLKVTFPNSKAYGLWHGQWDKVSMDIQIEAETSDGTAPKTGKILMISGRVMAVKGEVGEPGYEMDALDGAVLQQQLVLRLLGAALPDGVKGVKGSRKIDYSKQKTGIQFATPSAQGFITPPWRVKGTVTLVARDVVEYDLALTSGVRGKPVQQGGIYAANFSGRLSKSSSAKLDDSMSLQSWTLFGVGVQTKKAGDATIYDYTSAPSAEMYQTIADIRKQVAADNYPGERDVNKDFTGFWKSKCEDAFGLQIKPYGADGKYAIVFCGPGGCGNPDEARKTFITGDRNFEVVSEDELIEIYRSGEKQRSVRCTKDPHPVLKY
jgi:hypothetical protein